MSSSTARLAPPQGYSTGSPAGRYRGAIGYLGTLGLMGMVGRWAVTLLMPLLK